MSDFEQELLAARPYLQRFASKLTMNREAAEDLLGDTMVRVLANRDRFQPGTNFRGWAMFIMRNLFITSMRRKKWDGGSIDEMLASALPSSPAPQGDSVDLADTLKALEMLPRDQRDAVLLIGAGASYEEAAEELCCSVGTIKSRVARGRDALVEALA